MNIKQIKIHQLQMTLNHPFQTSFGTIEHKKFFIIEVIDHVGHRGFGESVAFTSPWYTEETVKTNLHIIKDFLLHILKNNEFTHPNDVANLF